MPGAMRTAHVRRWYAPTQNGHAALQTHLKALEWLLAEATAAS